MLQIDFLRGRIKQQVFDAKPDGVILMGGHNDIFFNRRWDRAAQNMRTMVDQARVNSLPVIVAIPPPIHLPVAFKEGGEQLKTGLTIKPVSFNPEQIQGMTEHFNADPSFAEHARLTGENLLALGGAKKAVTAMERLVNCDS